MDTVEHARRKRGVTDIVRQHGKKEKERESSVSRGSRFWKFWILRAYDSTGERKKETRDGGPGRGASTGLMKEPADKGTAAARCKLIRVLFSTRVRGV